MNMPNRLAMHARAFLSGRHLFLTVIILTGGLACFVPAFANIEALSGSDGITFFETHKSAIFILTGLLFFLSFIIGILLVSNHTKRKAERAVKLLNDKLVEKNRELEQVIYITSHDLRSPLVNIMGFKRELDKACQRISSLHETERDIDVFKKKLTEICESDVSFSLGFIEASINKIDSLLNGLLRISRLGSAALELKPLDMEALAQEVVKTLKFQSRECGATITVGEMPPCLGDEYMVNQIFTNLLGNALKYSDPARPGVISLHGSRQGPVSVYCVEDNGVGISQDNCERVFEIFQRAGANKGGEGLGLTIVRKICDRLNGRVRVESEPGKGSRFFVMLPYAKP
ncbi:MAG TPA: ATP-binding protein [Nitrospirota bacterium]|jgi:signal transduction histidine kinase